MMTHLMSFLCSCLNTHNTGDKKPYVDTATLSAAPPTQARIWAKEKFTACFPALSVPPAPTSPAHTNNPAIAALLAQILKQTASPQLVIDLSTPSKQPPSEADNKNNMSATELCDTLGMCGETNSGNASLLPLWMQDCALKGTSDAYKLTIICKWLMTTYHYNDADVPLTAPLLKIIQKRSWVGKDGNVTCPSLAHAMDGLSPFLMLDLSEDEVATINNEANLLKTTFLISIKDLQNFQKKLKIKVPESAKEFMLVLKRFANLLYALFTDQCPLFKCIKQVINALKDYSRAARKQMSIQTKGSILWIILLQARQFGLGESKILFEFQSMHSDLQAKRMHIHHSEVPLALLTGEQPGNKSSTVQTVGISNQDGGEEGASPSKEEQAKKKRRKDNPNNWHPKLKAELAEPLQRANYPSFTKIMQFCKQGDATHIYPRRTKICVPNACLGRCFHGEKCTKEHKLATASQKF